MQAILNSSLAHTKEITTINQDTVRSGVSVKAAELRQKIIERVKGHRFSLSADFGNRNGVDFFGKTFIGRIHCE